MDLKCSKLLRLSKIGVKILSNLELDKIRMQVKEEKQKK